MEPTRFSSTVKQLGLASVLGLSLVLGVTSAGQAQELPTGAARVVQKVQLMALTGTSEIKYKVDLIVANNAGKFPQP